MSSKDTALTKKKSDKKLKTNRIKSATSTTSFDGDYEDGGDVDKRKKKSDAKLENKSKSKHKKKSKPSLLLPVEECEGNEADDECDEASENLDPLDPTNIGIEIIQDLCETALDICCERFYHANDTSFVLMELTNTWLRIAEAEWLDEFKSEIENVSTETIFQGDFPISPMPFDTWSRGTLEILDPRNVTHGVKPSISKIASKGVTHLKFLSTHGQSDSVLREKKLYSTMETEGEAYLMTEPILHEIFSKRGRIFSSTGLTPEDGFNLPRIDAAGPPKLQNMEFPQNLMYETPGETMICVGEDEIDAWTHGQLEKRTITYCPHRSIMQAHRISSHTDVNKAERQKKKAQHY